MLCSQHIVRVGSLIIYFLSTVGLMGCQSKTGHRECKPCPLCADATAYTAAADGIAKTDENETQGRIGRLPADLLSIEEGDTSPPKIEISAKADGALTKIARYHGVQSAIPEAVRKRVRKAYPGATTLYFETEQHAGMDRTFEVEVKTREGQECEASAKADGTLLYTECTVEEKNLPAKILNFLKEKMPAVKIEEVEHKTGTKVDAFSIEVRDAHKRLHALRFDTQGNLLQHSLLIEAKIEVPFKSNESE